MSVISSNQSVQSGNSSAISANSSVIAGGSTPPPVNPVLTNMVNFYKYLPGFLEIDTQGNDDLTNSGVTAFNDPTQGPMAAFDGSDEFNGMGVSLTGEESFGFVYSPDDTGINILLGNTSGDSSIFTVPGTMLKVRMDQASGEVEFDTPVISSGNDYHLGITFEESGSDTLVNLFINGIISSSGELTVTNQAIAGYTVIGSYAASSSFDLFGKMKNFRRWDYKVSAADMLVVSNEDLSV